MQRISSGCVPRPLVPVDDRRALRHGVDQMGTPLDGCEAVREDGDLRDGHTVELRGVKHGILPQHEALRRLTPFGQKTLMRHFHRAYGPHITRSFSCITP